MSHTALFVDDDANYLNSIKRCCARYQLKWRVRFAQDGESALGIMASEPVNLIITDIKMPKMDGFELLYNTRKDYPLAARIINSGLIEHYCADELNAVSHQAYGKTSSIYELGRVFNAFSWLDRLPISPDVKYSLCRLTSLPYPLKNQYCLDHDSAIASYRELLKRFDSITNSTFHACNEYSIEDTVSQPSCHLDDSSMQIMADHMHHAEKIAYLSKVIAFEVTGDADMAQRAFKHGIYHDFGEVLMTRLQPITYAKMLSYTKGNVIERIESEKTFFGTTHAEMGAYLIGLWGWPQDLVASMALHHRPDRVQNDEFTPSHAVMVADALLASIEDPSRSPFMRLRPLLDQRIITPEEVYGWFEFSRLFD